MKASSGLRESQFCLYESRFCYCESYFCLFSFFFHLQPDSPFIFSQIRLSSSFRTAFHVRPDFAADCLIVPAEQVRVLKHSRGQVKVFKLLPDKIKGIEIDRLEIEPGIIMGGHPHLTGTKEYLTTMQGGIVVNVAGESYSVKMGDVFAFPGDQPHSYKILIGYYR